MVSMPVAPLPTTRLSTGGAPAPSPAASGVVVSMIALSPGTGTAPVSQLVAVNQLPEVAPVQLVSAANAGTQIAVPASAVVQNSAARRIFPRIFPAIVPGKRDAAGTRSPDSRGICENCRPNPILPPRHPLPHVLTGRRCPEGTAVEF